MHPSAPAAFMVTFVLRFQRETTAGESRWRGSIEHVPSGESTAFLDIDVMLSFLRRFGITAEDQHQLTREEV